MRLLTALTNAFPLWVVLGSVVALIEPRVFTWFSGPLIPIGLGIIMLSMGMTIGFDDFRRIGRERGRILPGVALQYTLMPALGWSLAWLFSLPTPFAVGLILVSCCPGGTASNVISFLARADVALSVTMTAVSTLLAVLMTEVLAGSRVDVPAAGLLVNTVQVVLLPVVGGAFLRWRFPVASQRILPMAPLLAVVAITLIVGSIIGAGQQQVLEAGPRLVAAILALHLGGFVLGYVSGRLILGREIAARTVSIEVGMQNSGLGVVLAQQNFANPLVALPCAISAVFHSLVGSAAAALWRARTADEQASDGLTSTAGV